MAEQRRLDGVVVTVDGSPLPTQLYARLMLVHVEESVQLPDYFVLNFDDPLFELFDDDRFRLGTRIEIAFRGRTFGGALDAASGTDLETARALLGLMERGWLAAG